MLSRLVLQTSIIDMYLPIDDCTILYEWKNNQKSLRDAGDSQNPNTKENFSQLFLFQLQYSLVICVRLSQDRLMLSFAQGILTLGCRLFSPFHAFELTYTLSFCASVSSTKPLVHTKAFCCFTNFHFQQECVYTAKYAVDSSNSIFSLFHPFSFDFHVFS